MKIRPPSVRNCCRKLYKKVEVCAVQVNDELAHSTHFFDWYEMASLCCFHRDPSVPPPGGLWAHIFLQEGGKRWVSKPGSSNEV